MWHGDGAASSWNDEWTLILFAAYLADTPSRRTGKPVKAKTIESYISLPKGFLDFTYSFDLVLWAPRLKRLIADIHRRRSAVSSGGRKDVV